MLLEAAWRVDVWSDRVPGGRAISVAAWWQDDELDVGAIELDHAWWIAVTVRCGEVCSTRWRASSAGASANHLVDDRPAVDAGLVLGDEPVDVEVTLWIRLDQEERVRRGRGTLGGEPALALALEHDRTAGWRPPPTVPAEILSPADVVAVPLEPLASVAAVLPGLGALVDEVGRWSIRGRDGRTPLPGFAVEPGARAEALTAGPGGRLAVVWSYGARGWHIHLHALPAPAPHAIIAPSPQANGNPPVIGAFADDGATALLPVGADAIGLVDTRSGAIRWRVSCGYVGHAALDASGDPCWIVSGGAARAFDRATGALVGTHPVPERRGQLFSARAGRLVWAEVFDEDGPTGLEWHDLSGRTGQLLIPDAVSPAVVLDDGAVVADGVAGLWYVDLDAARAFRFTGPLRLGVRGRRVLARRDGDRLTVWTTDPTHVKLVVRMPDG